VKSKGKFLLTSYLLDTIIQIQILSKKENFNLIQGGKMTKLKSLLLCLVMLSILITLGAQSSEWAVRAGGSELDDAQSIATDAAGISYIIGGFRGTATFGSTSLISNGGMDIYVAKLDANGNWLWAQRAGGTGEDIGYGIAIDNTGSICITGSFMGTAIFGLFPLTSVGGSDVFVAKFTTDGNWLWANRGGGTSSESTNDITTDDSGNCYITGGFSNSATFGTTNLTSLGGTDVFIAKLDTNGTWLWALRAGGISSASGSGIVCYENSYLFVTGRFYGTGDFGPLILTSAGNTDIFVCKLTTGGTWQAVTRAGGSNNDYGIGIALDDDGGIVITGTFIGVADFTVTSLTSINNFQDVFVARMDVNCYWLWAVRAGGSSGDQGNYIAADSNGFLYITGYFQGIAHFGATSLTSAGVYDIYIAKLDLSGNWLWARRCGGTGSEVGFGIATDSSGSCFATGYFMDTAYFGLEQLICSGQQDIYVTKVSDPTPKTPQNITISNLGNDIIVNWDSVTQDTWNIPIMPDYYLVYYNTDGTTEPFQYLTFIPATYTQYVHQHAGFFSPNHFYRVTAEKFFLADRSGLEDYLNANLRQGMTETEVKQVLQNIGTEF